MRRKTTTETPHKQNQMTTKKSTLHPKTENGEQRGKKESDGNSDKNKIDDKANNQFSNDVFPSKA